MTTKRNNNQKGNAVGEKRKLDKKDTVKGQTQAKKQRSESDMDTDIEDIVPVKPSEPLQPQTENGSSQELSDEDKVKAQRLLAFWIRNRKGVGSRLTKTNQLQLPHTKVPSDGAGHAPPPKVSDKTMSIDTSEIQEVENNNGDDFFNGKAPDDANDWGLQDKPEDKPQDKQSLDYGEYLKGKYFISTWLIPAVFFYVIAHSIEKGIFASDSVFIEGIGGLVSTCVCNLISNYSENVLSYIGQNRAEYFFQHTEEIFFVPCLVLPYILLYNLFVANQYCTEIIPSQYVWVVDDGFRYLTRTDEKEIESGYVYKNDYIFVWTFVILSIMAIYFRHKKYMYFWQVSLMSMYLLLAARITNSRILPTDPMKKYPSCSDLPNDTALIRSPEYWWPTRVLMWFLKFYTRVEDQTLYMALLGLENNGRHRFDLWFFGSY